MFEKEKVCEIRNRFPEGTRVKPAFFSVIETSSVSLRDI